jgi:peptidoglycan L-alanyl-D-glutamate endopeptidase CwlK
MYHLGKRSRTRLAGLHPDLVVVVATAITMTDIDFTVLEGRRSIERQRQLVLKGASQTLRSRHLTGHAVDLGAYVAGQVRWDWPLYHQINKAMKRAAEQCEINIEWGGDWKTFKDGPHFQLPWREYP